MRMNNVLVVGDIILDCYYSGGVTRISPEAPIPVVKLKDIQWVLGGASNVANNIVCFGGKSAVIGTIGEDTYGEKMEVLLQQNNVNIHVLNISPSFNSLCKIRVLGNRQQIVRIDCHDDEKPSNIDYEKMRRAFANHIMEYDVVVISDYDKGVCSEEFCKYIIGKAKECEKLIVVDPKGNNWGKYAGADIITPNLKEVAEYIGISLENCDEAIERECTDIHKTLNIENVIITRAELGMSLINTEGITHFRSDAREVSDVSGAGDTVVGVLASISDKVRNIKTVLKIANTAAGIAVSKRGTATVTFEEVEREMNYGKIRQVDSKIVTISELEVLLNSWKQDKQTIVFTNGCYDLLHKGHVYSIYSAAEFGDKLIVALNSDASVKRLKGEQRPINEQYDRAYVMASLGCVDAVVIFDEDSPEKILQTIKPDVLVKGGDYKKDQILGRQFAKKVEIIDYVDGYSTTKFIQKLNGEGKD